MFHHDPQAPPDLIATPSDGPSSHRGVGDMTLRGRLALGLFAIGLLLIAPLFLSLDYFARLSDRVESLSQEEFSASLLLSRLRAGTDELRDAEIALVYLADSTSLAMKRDQVLEALEGMETLTDSLAQKGLESEARALRRELRNIREYVPREHGSIARGQTRVADSISNYQMKPAFSRLEQLISAAEGPLQRQMQQEVEESARATQDARRTVDIGVLIALALATVIAIWLTQTISRPVRELEHGMKAVADGDFNVHLGITPHRHDEFGRLAASFQTMTTQLQQLDELKAEFVSVASHELKTPINVIIGYLQLLQENVYGDLTAKQREVCLTLASQANALSRLVRQLLDVSRFEAGGGKLDIRAITLSSFLGALESAFQVLAHQRGVRFRVQRSGFLPGQVFWDEDRMSEVLGNLLSNAFKFTERGGTVELRVFSDEQSVQMTVRDTGVGISAGHLPYIFEKFFQADNQSFASAKGTGLGLAIAKRIVEAHGGTIAAESAPGVGTTFFITMPVSAVPLRSVSTRVAIEAAAS